jgi:hypothetical protein
VVGAGHVLPGSGGQLVLLWPDREDVGDHIPGENAPPRVGKGEGRNTREAVSSKFCRAADGRRSNYRATC